MVGFFKELFAKIYSRLFFYPTLLLNYVNISQTRRWFDRIDDQVILGALPLRTFLPQFEEEKIGGVLSMNEYFETRYTILTQEQWANRGIVQQQLPTVDFFRAPTQRDIHRGIAFIKEVGERDRSVYVHCKAGRGRSTTVVACYLMQLHGIGPDEAVRRIKQKRSHINMCGEQMEAVRIFYRDNVAQKAGEFQILRDRGKIMQDPDEIVLGQAKRKFEKDEMSSEAWVKRLKRHKCKEHDQSMKQLHDYLSQLEVHNTEWILDEDSLVSLAAKTILELGSRLK